jgi:inhibitor of growth protein 3
MPRDDLSIDFVKKMPQGEALDPGLILEDWINRVQNLPEEIRFTHDEIQDKDRSFNDCIRLIEERDGKIQKWIKTNGSHEVNPKEDALRAQIREAYIRADQLSKDKIVLTQKLQHQFDKHIRNLDLHIKQLYDRNEPGFQNPDEVPSLLRPSAANHSAPIVRPTNPASGINLGGPTLAASNTVPIPPETGPARLPTQPRAVQAQQHVQQHASSAPTTPAASMLLNRQQRESSAGPTPKRGARTLTGLGATPATSSGLARHSSLGPGTPKGAANAGPVGTTRAGSAGPRSGSVKAGSGVIGRRGTPQATSRKKPPNKSSLSRVKKASARNSPASTADSDLSDAVSGSEIEENDAPTRRTPLESKGTDGDENLADADEEDDEGSDDKKYCLCHNVSYGDMVACDNDDCPYEWFHWSCVGLKSEPNGLWYCPVCTEKFGRKGK